MFRGIRRRLLSVAIGLGIAVPLGVMATDTVVEQGWLPPTVTQSYFNWEAGFAPVSEQSPFRGEWTGRATSNVALLEDGTECGAGNVTMHVHGLRLSGLFEHDTEGYSLQVFGEVDGRGNAGGGIAQGSENFAEWSVLFAPAGAEGTWHDAYGCTGTLALTAPPRFQVEGLNGRAFLDRGLRPSVLTRGMALQSGDIVRLEAGAEATLRLDGKQMRLHGPVAFEVPWCDSGWSRNPEGACVRDQEPGWAAAGWDWLKGVIVGESFEIKTPTAIAGVRG